MAGKSKNILFLSNRGLLPIKDGHTRRSFNILKGLAEKNKVYFLSLYETPAEVSYENVKQLEKICHRVEFLPCPSKKISLEMLTRLFRSLFSFEPYTVWRHYSKPFLKRVDELISSKRFDLVHCDILPICYTVQNRAKIFRSVTDHDVSYQKCLSIAKDKRNLFLKYFMYLEAWKLKRLEKNIFKHVDLGVAVSESDKKSLQKLCPEGKFLVVENGVELDKFQTVAEMPEKSKLLWLGGFGHYPNIQGILFFLNNVYPQIKKAVPGVSLDIVGGGVTVEIKQFAERDSTINVTGYVDDPLPYLHRAAVFVAPILSGGGTKLKVLEAMAAGKAVVTTSKGCEGIDGMPGQHYLVADDHDHFAENVIRLLNDKLLRSYIQDNAKKLVNADYDFNTICIKLDDYYNFALNRQQLQTFN